MGIFNKKKQQMRSIVKEYYGNDFSLFIQTYASNIYSIPEVRTAIESFSDIFSTIPKRHERVDKDGNITYFNDNVTKILSIKPNPLQNSTMFWKEVVTRLMLDSNVFIEPIFDTTNGDLKALYVLPSSNFQLDFINDSTAFVTFNDLPSNKNKYNLNEIIYLNRFSSLAGGKKNNLGLYEKVVQALAQQALNVADPKKVRAIMQGKQNISANLKKPDRKGVMDDVKANFVDNVDGMAYLDSQWDITPINWQENDVNKDLMQLVINVVYNYFGISESIVNGKANELEYSMFIANKINPLARQIEQEFTSKLFTQNEVDFGNKIELDTFRLSASTLQAKTALFSVASRQGIMNNDEMRNMIGLPPIPDGYGKMFRVTADTIDITKVNEYQAAQKGAKDNKNTNEEDETGDGQKSDV